MSKPRLMLQMFNEEVEQVQEVETQQEVTEETQEVTESVQEEAPEPFLSIKYNKEDVALDRERAIELTQKGMNYDKIYEKVNTYEQELEQLRNDPARAYMNDFLKQNGYESFDEYQKALEMQNLHQEKPHLTKDEIEELYFGRKEKEARQREKQQRETQESQAQRDRDAIARYEEKFGTLDVKKLAPEVLEMYQNGVDLVIAQELHELRTGQNKAKIEQEAIEKLKQNSTSSTGSATKGNPDHNTSWSKMSKADFEARKAEVLRMQR